MEKLNIIIHNLAQVSMVGCDWKKFIGTERKVFLAK